MCRVTRHHRDTRKHHISTVTEELPVEAKLGIHDIRHYVHSESRVLRYLGHVFRMDADRTLSLLQRCWVVDGKQPSSSGKTNLPVKVLYDSAVHCVVKAI